MGMRITYLLIPCLLLSISCSKHEDDVNLASNEITFEAGTLITKGILNNTSLHSTGTQIKLYGYCDGNEIWNTENELMSDTKLVMKEVEGAPEWQIFHKDETSFIEDNQKHFHWLQSGLFRFYGWLQYDSSTSTSNPLNISYDEANSTLTVSDIVNKDYDQFDFIYSDVATRRVSSPIESGGPFDPVKMEFRHLFSAFSLGAINTTDKPIVINSVTINGIHDTGNAYIVFGQNKTEISYGPTSLSDNDTRFIINTQPSTVPAANDSQNGYVADILNNQDSETYYMTWPQNQAVVSPSNPTGQYNQDGTPIYESSDSLIVVNYTLGNSTYTRKAKFPAKNWEAGRLYHFDLQFADKIIELKAIVSQWDYEESDIDFEDKTISFKESGKLTWSHCDVDDNKKEVRIQSGQPAVATFCFDSPDGGVWIASLEGDYNAFKIEESIDIINDGRGPIDKQPHSIRITPLITSPERDYSVTLNLAVQTVDGSIISANEILEGKGEYNIVLKKH